MTPLKWFSGFLKKYRLVIVIGLVLMTVIVACAIVNPYISGMIVDDVIQGGAYDLLPKLIGIMLAVTAVRAILRYATQMMFETCSQGVLYRMRDAVYRKLLQEDFAFYNRNRTGDLMSRQTGDMDAIRHFVAFVIYTVYENILMFIFAVMAVAVDGWDSLGYLFLAIFTGLMLIACGMGWGIWMISRFLKKK